MNFSARLKQLRRERSMSQGELADAAGINRSYLSMVENDRSSPTMEVVQRLAKGLELNIWQLLTDIEEKHFTYELPDEGEIYPGLKELFNSDEDMLLINPSIEEIELLKSIRFSGNYQPSKKFFIEALLDFRRSKRQNS